METPELFEYAAVALDREVFATEIAARARYAFALPNDGVRIGCTGTARGSAGHRDAEVDACRILAEVNLDAGACLRRARRHCRRGGGCGSSRRIRGHASIMAARNCAYTRRIPRSFQHIV